MMHAVKLILLIRRSDKREKLVLPSWQKQHWLPLFLQTLAPLYLGYNCRPVAQKCVACRLWPPVTGVTFELLSLVLGDSQLGSLVLTQRLLVQLIAICIALLVSQHCLRDISVFFTLFSSPCSVSLRLRLVLRILGRRIRQCLACD